MNSSLTMPRRRSTDQSSRSHRQIAQNQGKESISVHRQRHHSPRPTRKSQALSCLYSPKQTLAKHQMDSRAKAKDWMVTRFLRPMDRIMDKRELIYDISVLMNEAVYLRCAAKINKVEETVIINKDTMIIAIANNYRIKTLNDYSIIIHRYTNAISSSTAWIYNLSKYFVISWYE